MNDLFYQQPATARDLRDAGMAQAIRREREEWLRAYLMFITDYARRSKPFIAEDVRTAWLKAGLPPPHHHNVWGAAFNSAVRRGIVGETGSIRQMQTAKSHARRTPEWSAKT